MSEETSESTDDDVWESDRHKIIHKEGVRVLQAQKTDIDDLDDKALRTVRIIAVLLAVGASVIEIGQVDPNETTILFSIGLFLLSSIFGIIVYSESYEVVGPKASYLEDLETNSLSKPWREDYIHQFPGWVSENQTTVEINTYFLNICQFFFMLALATGILSLTGLETGPIFLLILGLAATILIIIKLVAVYVQATAKD
jgi:hypothetical protein